VILYKCSVDGFVLILSFDDNQKTKMVTTTGQSFNRTLLKKKYFKFILLWNLHSTKGLTYTLSFYQYQNLISLLLVWYNFYFLILLHIFCLNHFPVYSNIHLCWNKIDVRILHKTVHMTLNDLSTIIEHLVSHGADCLISVW
jgi:hypothetical protein